MVSQTEIEKLVNTVVEIEHPQKVVLFGSYANDNAHDESDVDLLVIVKQSNTSKLARMKNIRQQLGKFNFFCTLSKFYC